MPESDVSSGENTHWSGDVHAVLKDLGVRQVVYVPDAGHKRLIEMCAADPDMVATQLTTEEEGIAMLSGAFLGGDRGVLLMQSSGVGNCMNMLSLTYACRFPLLMLVTMRGQWGEFVSWQMPTAKNTPKMLQLYDVLVQEADRIEEVAEIVEAAGRTAFDGPNAVAVLISQRVIGSKKFTR